MNVLTGKQFNETYPNIEFYKVINKNLKDGDYVYRNGLNQENLEGFIFTNLDNIRYCLFGDIICSVTIPDNAVVCTNEYEKQGVLLTSFNADKLIIDLDNKLPSSEFEIVSEYNNWLASLDFSNKMRLKKCSIRENLIFFNKKILKNNLALFYSGLFMIGALTNQYLHP